MQRNPELIPASLNTKSSAESGNGSDHSSIYEDIVAESPQAVLVLDAECRIVFSNAKAAEMAGKAPKDLAGRDVREWSEFATDELRSACTRAVKDRQPSSFEHRSETGDWFEVQLRPCRAGVAVFFSNVTDRKRAEVAADERETELRDFIENATMALHWVGPDGTILWANDTELKLLGYTREEYIGHNITEFHVDQPVISDILCRLANNEELHSYESRLRCKDGTIRNVAINSNVYFRNGEFVHTRCFTRDITKEKIVAELQQRLAAIVECSDDAFQHIGILSLEFHVDKLSRPLL